MPKNIGNKIACFGIALLFVLSTFVSVIGSSSQTTNTKHSSNDSLASISEEQAVVTCSTYGIGSKDTEQKVKMRQSEARQLLEKIETYSLLISQDPHSPETKKLQEEIINIAADYHLVPKDTLSDIRKMQLPKKRLLPKLSPNPMSSADEWFCNYAAGGEGSSTPVIIFPRLTPILLFPIPRLFYRWNCRIGFSSCGGLRSGTGFMAEGQQTGRAIGFWGIGFSVFLPPVMAFGIIGYALYCSVEAEQIEYWPPNYPPDINPVFPLDGAINIPLSTSELSFHIDDYENELMSYSVTTSPDIGGDNANLKPDGTYNVPISGLEGTETYSWTVTVSDGPNTVEKTYSFTTESVAPIVENPTPEDGERYVPITISELRCHIRDPQGDSMDYTVETSPHIGSDSGSIIGNGIVNISVGGLDNMTEYRWYVNVTDGSHWKHKVFSFQTEPTMVFNPFEEGWHYRKNVTIDHTKVISDFSNFPVLISAIDTDLRDKAQKDGDDILFMDSIGEATRLYHEIEYYEDTSGELVAWINFSSLSSTSDTVIQMYYGNSGACNQQAPEKVWDSHYQGVWHMKEFGMELRDDSTQYSRHATPQKYDGDEGTSNGMIDGADNFDGNNDHAVTGISFDYEYRTVSFWFNAEKFPSSDTKHILNQDSNTLVYGSIGALIRTTGLVLNAGREQITFPHYPINLNNWYFVQMIRNGLTTSYYINGVLYHSGQSGSGGSSYGANKNFVFATDRTTDRRYFDGTIDDIRVSNIARSEEWIITEYNNQNNPNTFYLLGPEETGP